MKMLFVLQKRTLRQCQWKTLNHFHILMKTYMSANVLIFTQLKTLSLLSKAELILLFTCRVSTVLLYTASSGRCKDLLLLTTPLYHFQRHSNLNQCFKWLLGFKSLWYLRRMSGLYWECAGLNTTSWWMDLPIIFFHRSLTPPLLGDCWLWWIGARGEHFPGLSRQQAVSACNCWFICCQKLALWVTTTGGTADWGREGFRKGRNV